jgi:hypothetical protein
MKQLQQEKMRKAAKLRKRNRLRLLAVLLLPVSLILGALGCTHTSSARLQVEDESDKEKEQVELIRDVTALFENADPITCHGVGLVVGLDGTGGGAPPGGYRKMLEDALLKRRVENVKQVLDSPTTSLVLVSVVIPPGARKNDLLDVQVTLPRESKTTSLRGGRLLETILYHYGTRKGLNPDHDGPDGLVKGHAIAKAAGALVVGFGDGDDAERLREARIWGGGKSAVDRPLYLMLSEGKQQARIVQAVAEAINTTFHGTFRGPSTDLAVAKTKAVVCLGVPVQYRLNLPRYMRVVRLIPLWDAPDQHIAYRRRLEKQLLDPTHTVTAALRLEALGKDSEPTLKRALASEHPLVRFCAAEALAYLGSPSCGEELSHLVEQQPLLRAFSLTAIASLDQPVSHIELRRLLGSPSAETRYGAFRALRALDDQDELVQGVYLNDSFWLHRVAPKSAPLVHLSTSKRAEIVLFGEDAYLIPPFPILAGDFTITAGRDDTRCTIKRISVRHGQSERQCSLKLEDVLKTLAELGGTYAEALELLRRADHLQCLSCKVAVDALPQRIEVEDLAKAGAGDPELAKTHPEILDAKADFSPTPNLFDAGPSSRPAADSKDRKAKAPKLNVAEESGISVLDTRSDFVDQPSQPVRVHGGIQ